MLSLYNILICLVAAVLYAAVNNFEPNSRHASVLKALITALAVAAILAHLMPFFGITLSALRNHAPNSIPNNHCLSDNLGHRR
jgi:small neutral amino acid transporter SnatA (MarC family)